MLTHDPFNCNPANRQRGGWRGLESPRKINKHNAPKQEGCGDLSPLLATRALAAGRAARSKAERRQNTFINWQLSSKKHPGSGMSAQFHRLVS